MKKSPFALIIQNGKLYNKPSTSSQSGKLFQKRVTTLVNRARATSLVPTHVQ